MGASPGREGKRRRRRGGRGQPAGSPAPHPDAQPLCVEDEGFTLHARTRVAKDRRGELEVLWRYILRPPLAIDRVRLRQDGLVELLLRRRWSEGTTALTSRAVNA